VDRDQTGIRKGAQGQGDQNDAGKTQRDAFSNGKVFHRIIYRQNILFGYQPESPKPKQKLISYGRRICQTADSRCLNQKPIQDHVVYYRLSQKYL
jgi:hypothetical protein